VRAAVLAAFAFLAVAPAAAGAATVERLVAVGPVLDGESVTWGEGGWGADLSVHTWRPDGSVVERWRRPADTRPRHTLQWGGYSRPFAASPTWLAFYTVDQFITQQSGDSSSGTSTDTLWAGRDGAPPSVRSAKVGPPGCRYEPQITGVVADGPRLAWSEYRIACARRTDLPRVTVVEGDTLRVFRLAPGQNPIRGIRLAGLRRDRVPAGARAARPRG
jgi:hypothetical protein